MEAECSFVMIDKEHVRLLREQYDAEMAEAWHKVTLAMEDAELQQYNYVDKLLDELNKRGDK
jgi:hypothetical protein